MMILFLIMNLIFFIFFLILNILPIINIHKMNNREKNSPFECGFDPFIKNRINFSIHFFIISMMFLIFDIEITLILPLPIIFNMMNKMFWMLMFTILIIMLMMGLLLEWKENSMEWK